MYGKEEVETVLEALSLGFNVGEAARLAGVSRSTADNWKRGAVPHGRRDAAPARIVRAQAPERREDPMEASDSEKRLYRPPRSGPLAGLEPGQIENLLLRAVLADLKAAGWDPASISNRSKCELGERLRAATGLPLRSITAFLRISKSSYEYHRARLGKDGSAALRAEVRALFEAGDSNWGYRTIWGRLRWTTTPAISSGARRRCGRFLGPPTRRIRSSSGTRPGSAIRATS